MRPIIFVYGTGKHEADQVGEGTVKVPYFKRMMQAHVKPITDALGSRDWQWEPHTVTGTVNVTGFWMRQLQTQPTKCDVMIGHGLADKHYRNYHQCKTFRYVVSPGPGWTRKLLKTGFKESQILEVGYTKLDPIYQGKFTPTPRTDDRPRVLYAGSHPWHDGGSGKDAILRALPEDKYNVTFAGHPSQTGVVTFQPLVDADVVIADMGSLMYEGWALGKPVVVSIWTSTRLLKAAHSLEQGVFQGGYGYQADNPEELPKFIDRALKNGIDAPARKFIDDLFAPEYHGVSGKLHAEALKKIANQL